MALRRSRGLVTKPLIIVVLQIGGLAAVVAWAVWYANRDRGVPFVMVVLFVFLVFWSFVAARTAFGRHVYAVGGSPEAARRAGINVDRIRIAVFMIVGVHGRRRRDHPGLAASVRSSTNTGGGNLLLNIIAAAVIGGTSLFGGRGRPVNALLGALVIASVANGMDLLGPGVGHQVHRHRTGAARGGARRLAVQEGPGLRRARLSRVRRGHRRRPRAWRRRWP